MAEQLGDRPDRDDHNLNSDRDCERLVVYSLVRWTCGHDNTWPGDDAARHLSRAGRPSLMRCSRCGAVGVTGPTLNHHS